MHKIRKWKKIICMYWRENDKVKKKSRGQDEEKESKRSHQ